MKYLSLFSGIGGFEVAIHRVYPDFQCIGYSEVKPHAIKVYEHHFPDHKNLGDITKITTKQIKDIVRKAGGCDLIVGGFPCTNLSSLATISPNVTSDGVNGKKSGLVYDLLRILKIILKINPKVNFIFENNASMTKINRKLITKIIQNVYKGDVSMTLIDNAVFGVQTRKRLFWTNFYVKPPTKEDDLCVQVWEDVLEPVNNVKDFILTDNFVEYLNRTIKSRLTKYLLKTVKVQKDIWKFKKIMHENTSQTRFQTSFLSDTTNNQEDTPSKYPLGKSRPVLGSNPYIIDRRNIKQKSCFCIRKLSPIEMERLFGLNDNYTLDLPYTKKNELLGNSVSVFTIEYILKYTLTLPKSQKT